VCRGFGGKGVSETGSPLAIGMEIGYVVRDAKKGQVDIERDASEFDAGYYRKLLETAWEEAGFIFYSQLSRKYESENLEYRTRSPVFAPGVWQQSAL
jgi:hypothetical protein